MVYPAVSLLARVASRLVMPFNNSRQIPLERLSFTAPMANFHEIAHRGLSAMLSLEGFEHVVHVANAIGFVCCACQPPASLAISAGVGSDALHLGIDPLEKRDATSHVATVISASC
jgi:hypothetical protein